MTNVFLTNLNSKIFYHIIGPFMGGGCLNVQTKPGGLYLSPHRSVQSKIIDNSKKLALNFKSQNREIDELDFNCLLQTYHFTF